VLRRRIPLLVALLPLVVLIGGGRATSTSVTFTSVADAYVTSTSPTSNTGTSTSIRVDGSPIVRSYVRFSVAGVSGPVGQAVLRVYANSSQNKGYSVYAVADTSWSETVITYANAPPFAATAAGASGRVTAGTWTSVDVTSLVKGNGTYSLGLATSSPTALSLSSREAGANAPQLVVSITSTQAPPANTAPPSIAGSPQQGQPSSADPGTWSGSPSSFGYRWRLCPSATDATACTDIAGATAQSYTPQQGDVGGYLRVDVTATNGGGTSAPAESAAAGPVAAINPPANSTSPAVTGILEVGRLLQADPGSWSGNPTSYGYTWRVCSSATDTSACADIVGQQGPTYTPQATDIGRYLRVDVTATNGGGTSAPAESAAAGPVSSASSDPVIAAAGDIACDPVSTSFNGGAGTSGSCHQRATSDLLLSVSPAAVLTLGDNVYECGSPTAFALSFDPSWGRVKTLIHPAVGNHEYETGTDCSTTAAGYFGYFGAAAGDPAKGYYSYDVGVWHLIALNANCSKVGGCAAGQPEEQWLRADLASHQNACVLAYWHQPHFSSGQHGNDDGGHNLTGAFWQALYDFHADVVLNGHDHDYERFAPQTPAGALDPANGIREFVAGTGGKSQASFAVVQPNSEIRNSGTYGVLLLTLHPGGYDWQFVAEAGKSFSDAGSGSCH
jgi:hypothetical protein